MRIKRPDTCTPEGCDRTQYGYDGAIIMQAEIITLHVPTDILPTVAKSNQDRLSKIPK